MVALLRPQPQIRSDASAQGQLRLVVDNGRLVAPSFGGSVRDRVEDRLAARRSVSPSSAAGPAVAGIDRSLIVSIVFAAVVVFGGLALLRSTQGGPNADVLDGANATASTAGPSAGSVAAASLAPGDQIIIAQSGDSLWSIAEELAPGTDPRPVVSVLIEANGNDSLQIGQQIVIPEQLLD